MNRYSSSRVAAIGMYFILGLWPLMVIWFWLYTSITSSISKTLSPPGATTLFLTLLILLAGSIVEVVVLSMRLGNRKAVVRMLLVIGALLVLAGLSWGIVAAVTYSLGTFFLV